MTALFDRPWQERLLGGETEAALQLARSVLQPLYEYCSAQLADQQATQQAVHHTLCARFARSAITIRKSTPTRFGIG